MSRNQIVPKLPQTASSCCCIPRWSVPSIKICEPPWYCTCLNKKKEKKEKSCWENTQPDMKWKKATGLFSHQQVLNHRLKTCELEEKLLLELSDIAILKISPSRRIRRVQTAVSTRFCAAGCSVNMSTQTAYIGGRWRGHFFWSF